MGIFDKFKKLFDGDDNLEENNESSSSGIRDVLKKGASIFDSDSDLPEVTLNGNVYRCSGYTIEVKKEGTKKWSDYTELPFSGDDIRVSNDGQLLVLGLPDDYDGFKEAWNDIKESFTALATINESGNDPRRWFKIGEDGNISVAIDSNELDDAENFCTIKCEGCRLIIDGKECYCRVYKMSPRNSFISSDRVHWKKSNSFSDNFRRFTHSLYDNVTFVQDKTGNYYAYWDEWRRMEFEAELEIFEDDSHYDEVDKVFYKYQNDKKEIISKRVHILFLKGDFGKYDSSIVFYKKDGCLDYHSSLPGHLDKMPKKVESYCGEVFITMENDIRYIYLNNEWVESMKWNRGYGPFFFKTSLNENDPVWSLIHTDIVSIEDGKDKADNRRPVYFKILKADRRLVYYSENGKDWYKHSELPSQFVSLTSTAYLRYAKTFETVVYGGGDWHFQLAQNPAGLFKKGYRNIWKNYDKKNLLSEYSGDSINSELYLQIYDLGGNLIYK